MKKIIRHIEFLLMTHECVIIPGFGAILARRNEAVYNAETEVWTPPTRALAFNPELNHNDGLLAGSVARRDRVSIDSALSLIDDAVNVMRRTLESEGTLQLGLAGRLTLLPDGRLTFTPGNATRLSPEFMWLPEISTPAVASASQLERASELLSRRERMAAALRRAGGWAACLTILFTLGWIVYRNMGLNPGAQFASIFPIDKQAEPIAEPQNDNPFMLIMASAPADEVIENMPAQVPDETPKPTISLEGRYCLIVASFNTDSEAELFISSHRDVDLAILNKDGRSRVFAAAGPSIEEVTAAGNAEPLASLFPSRWICRR